jgi:tetratricopeptide (TPR) repeat protein
MAWTFELPAWFSLVEGSFHDTIAFAEAGLELAPNSSAGVQLGVQRAKAWARLGVRRGVEEAIRQAATSLASLPVPAHPEHHFIFDATKLSFYATTCYTWLGEAEEAEEHAREVVKLCLSSPGTVRWPTRLAETRVDLGLIAVQRGDLEEACHLGGQALASERQAGSTLARVAELDAALQQEHADTAEARDFHERFIVARRALAQGTAT